MSTAQTIGAPRHFADLSDVSAQELRFILDSATSIKGKRIKGQKSKDRPLEGKVLAMIFDKPSTRTRVSFDVGMRELAQKCSLAAARQLPIQHASCHAMSMPS